MKTKGQRFITILITFIMMLSMQIVVASAKEDSGVSIDISTDKRAYEKGSEVDVNVKIQNKNNFDINNISLISTLPAGITLVDNSQISSVGKSLKAGEKKSITIKAKSAVETSAKIEQSTATINENKNDFNTQKDATKTEGNTVKNPGTNDSKQGLIVLSFVLVSVLGIGWSFKNRKDAIKKTSIILFLLIGVQLLPANCKAQASEVSLKEIKFDVVKDIIVGEEVLKYKLEFTSNYELKADTSNIVYSEEKLIADEDTDKDGLTNAEEEKLGASPYNMDSDEDSLSDYDEVKVYNTNPLNEDTDSDGVLDGEEIIFNLNPLQKKTDGVNIDGTKTFEREVVSDSKDVSVKIKGNSGILSTTIDQKDSPAFNSFAGLYSKVKEFHCNEKFDSAVISFPYTEEGLKGKKMNANDLSIYYFNENTHAFEKIPSTIDSKNKIVSAEVKHFSSYALGDTTKNEAHEGTEVSFLIDNSGSMYSKALCNGSDENDINFKRVDFANSLIDKLSSTKNEKFEFSACKFTATYKLLANMTSDAEAVKKSISSIKDVSENFDGTHIGTSMKSVLNNYKNDDYKHKKYIVLLTDGVTTEGDKAWGAAAGYPKAEDIRNLALEKGVVVFAVGLGTSVDKEYLMKMSTETGGDYYIANDANSLNEIYKKIAGSINYNEIDTNADGVNDSIVLADSDFKVTEDGFSFQNGHSTIAPNGQCYGMAVFAEKYYTKTLPLSLDDVNINNAYTYFGEKVLGQSEWMAPGYDLKDHKFFGLSNSSISAGKLYNYVPEEDNKKDEVFKSLDRLYVSQKFLKNLDNLSSIEADGQKSLDKLEGFLNLKSPKVIGMGTHYINAIRLIRDKDDNNNYTLYVYDNNYPGQERKMLIQRHVMKFLGVTTGYSYTVEYTSGSHVYKHAYVTSDIILKK